MSSAIPQDNTSGRFCCLLPGRVDRRSCVSRASCRPSMYGLTARGWGIVRALWNPPSLTSPHTSKMERTKLPSRFTNTATGRILKTRTSGALGVSIATCCSIIHPMSVCAMWPSVPRRKRMVGHWLSTRSSPSITVRLARATALWQPFSTVALLLGAIPSLSMKSSTSPTRPLV